MELNILVILGFGLDVYKVIRVKAVGYSSHHFTLRYCWFPMRLLVYTWNNRNKKVNLNPINYSVLPWNLLLLLLLLLLLSSSSSSSSSSSLLLLLLLLFNFCFVFFPDTWALCVGHLFVFVESYKELWLHSHMNSKTLEFPPQYCTFLSIFGFITGKKNIRVLLAK